MSEKLVRSALFMDRDESLGNSLDRYSRRALHVKVGNTEPIAVTFDGATTQCQYFDVETQTIVGSWQTLISHLVLTPLTVNHVRICCRMSSRWRLLIDNSLIASGFLGAAHVIDDFTWSLPRKVEAGSTIELKFLHLGTLTLDNQPVTVTAHLETRLA